ncbi:MAG: cation:proton antiporter [Geminicoccaceae bacterium]
MKVTLSLSFAEHPEELLHFAEFGVVLFLFVIGLELNPARLWAMRTDIFGLGLAQVLVSGAVLTVPALLAGLSWQAALVVGLGLALSSTALVMRVLDERRQRATAHGRKALAILLFQDLAIVPLLLLVAVLAPSGEDMGLGESLVHVAMGIGAIALLVAIGRYGLDPMFHLLARAGMSEIMTAAALGVVIAAGLLMDVVGMSYAMGAFIAGVMLAESTFRHEVEANIEPFRGLFLGLFFMAVGLSLDLEAVRDNLVAVLLLTPLIMAVKALLIYCLTRLFGSVHDVAVRTALALPQSGEFGFVLFAAALGSGLLGAAEASTLVALVTLSMALTPLTSKLEPLLIRGPAKEHIDEDYSDAAGRALLIGFGRFVQVLSQPLFAQNIETIILDNDPARIREAKTHGFRVHFGDGTRRDVLRAAGAGAVDLIIVAVDNAETANKIVDVVRAEFPQARLFVRAIDRRHSISLMRVGVDGQVRETFESALHMGEEVLMALGIPAEDATAAIERVRAEDRDRLRQEAEERLDPEIDGRKAAAPRI